MGNCQAVDAATLVIQHPNGKVDNLYWSISAAEVMKANPGHCVALLLSTTLYPPPPPPPPPPSTAAASQKRPPPPPNPAVSGSSAPVRLTRIKLLRPTDTLTLGHVYRLITNQEVMKGLWAKKQSKLSETQKGQNHHHTVVESDVDNMQRKQSSSSSSSSCSSTEPLLDSARRSLKKKEKNRSSSWQPSLHSILESAGGSSTATNGNGI
ncbi:hypothetical protein LINGRAHAP2_LOCUS16327 [Linum grandiflorum]